MSASSCRVLLLVLGFAGCQAEPRSAVQQATEPAAESTELSPSDPAPGAVAYTALDQRPDQVVLADPNCETDPSAVPSDAAALPEPPQRKLWLGIQAEPAPRVLLDQFDLPCGLVVTTVVKGAPSEGLLYPSDVIYQFNGNDLACEKRLCAMIAEAGSLTCRLAIIRKMKRLEVDIMPQPVEFLGGGQVAQYTIGTNNDTVGVLDMPRVPEGVAEKLRMFVFQPIVMVEPTAGQAIGTAPQDGQLELERIVSFGQNEQGEEILIIQEAGRTLTLKAEDIKNASPEIQQLWNRVKNQP
ncbi:MAG: hypothetical protein JNL67_00880 [Planctomycetaceae bacterium]|nr:hypothetical protein [Planctomycetaceae bacterium]